MKINLTFTEMIQVASLELVDWLKRMGYRLQAFFVIRRYLKKSIQEELVSIPDLYKELKSKSKNEIIVELAETAARITGDKNGIIARDKFMLRHEPKKRLARALILLKIQEEHPDVLRTAEAQLK